MDVAWKWSGYARPAHAAREFHLTIAGTVVKGSSASLADFKEAMRILARVPLVPGPYKPFWNHSDDYPSVQIVVTGESGTVRFHTKSQGAGHAPWAVDIAGTTLVVPSDAPQKAVDLLAPGLERRGR